MVPSIAFGRRRLGSHTTSGSEIADEGLFLNLARGAAFSECHVFVDDVSAARAWSPETSRVRILPTDALDAMLGTTGYRAFYVSQLDMVLGLMRERDRRRLRFPIISLIYAQRSFEYYALAYRYFLQQRPNDIRIAPSEAGQKTAERLFASFRSDHPEVSPPRIETIPLGIAPSELVVWDKAHARRALGMPSECRLLLVVGRFDQLGKADLFPPLSALAGSLRRTGSHLVLAGADGAKAYASQVRRFAAALGVGDHCTILPNVTHEIKCMLYSAADVFLSFPDSLQETFGLCILEALHYGLPIVCADWNGYKELVVHGRNGFRIPVYGHAFSFLRQTRHDDPRRSRILQKSSVALDLCALRLAVEHLARDPALCEAVARANRRVARRYQWRTIVAMHEKLLERASPIEWRAPSTQPSVPDERLVLDVAACFGHYPTTFELFSDTATRVKADSEWLPVGDYIERFYREESAYLNGALGLGLLEDVLDWCRSSCAIDEVLARGRGHDPQTLLFHVMWLLKHGFLRLGMGREC